MGVDAYFPLCAEYDNPSIEQMLEFWDKIMEDGVHNGVNGGYMTVLKIIIFKEIFELEFNKKN